MARSCSSRREARCLFYHQASTEKYRRRDDLTRSGSPPSLLRLAKSVETPVKIAFAWEHVFIATSGRE
jgi:hypothetical protein